MIWMGLLALSLVITAICAIGKDWVGAKIGLAMFGGYLAMRGNIALWGGTDMMYYAGFGIWAGVAVFALWVDTGDTRQAMLYGVNLSQISLMLFGVSLCYIIASVLKSPASFLSIPFVVSDLLAVLAMVLIGRGGILAVFEQYPDLVGFDRDTGGGAGVHSQTPEPQKDA